MLAGAGVSSEAPDSLSRHLFVGTIHFLTSVEFAVVWNYMASWKVFVTSRDSLIVRVIPGGGDYGIVHRILPTANIYPFYLTSVILILCEII